MYRVRSGWCPGGHHLVLPAWILVVECGRVRWEGIRWCLSVTESAAHRFEWAGWRHGGGAVRVEAVGGSRCVSGRGGTGCVRQVSACASLARGNDTGDLDEASARVGGCAPCGGAGVSCLPAGGTCTAAVVAELPRPVSTSAPTAASRAVRLHVGARSGVTRAPCGVGAAERRVRVVAIA